MATLRNNSILGDYFGAIGTVVLSKWKGIFILKSRPIKRTKKTKSGKVIQQNNVFGMVSSFLASALEMINLCYQGPKLATMTPFNAAVAYHLKNAFTGDPNDPGINLELIKFGFPIRKTQSVWNPMLSLGEGNNVLINWETNPFPHKNTELDDKVILVFYNKNGGVFRCIRKVIERSDLSFTEKFDRGYAGDEIYWYLFLISADGKLVSETEYLGMVTIAE